MGGCGSDQTCKNAIAALCMFFAGLILLIPHRIGMSRVNYVIKRYNLPISRAGLLLYKYHNNIELSLLHGTLAGNIIVWSVGQAGLPKWYVSGLMIAFLSLMLISSIIMFIIYISGDDFGHLNAFYFSLIFLTLFDGFTNAFAFAINPKFSSMLSAGIPLSGLLVTLLHNVYKSYSDKKHWDDFDFFVLLLQLLCNIILIFCALMFWSYDYFNQVGDVTQPLITPLFQSGDGGHICDWCPICMLAISLGTVYAFYPSIAPYSIIDFQYAAVIELWILVISALLPFAMAILDLVTTLTKYNLGPSGQSVFLKPQTPYTLKVTHATGSTVTEHPAGTKCNQSSPNTTEHDYQKDWKPGPNDKWKDSNNEILIKDIKSGSVIISNWFSGRDLSKAAAHNKITNPQIEGGSPDPLYAWWNCFWICAIFYILCIQIFMSLLHYPDCLLSSFFNNSYRIGFISVLFNTLREILQALGFAGAGKQSRIVLKGFAASSDTPLYKTFNDSNTPDLKTGNPTYAANKLTIKVTGTKNPGTFADSDLVVGAGTSIIIPDPDLLNADGTFKVATINGTIASTNKLITLFVMMFCVFTGDGYLQHYRRCCRDCWPTTGYNKYQSFFYWLHYGFKGGIKSITSSFTDLYYHNLRPQFISYA